MARPKVKAFLDMDNRDLKRRFMSWIGTLSGIYEVEMQPRRNTRSVEQNKLWWGYVCTPLYHYMREHGINVRNAEDVHEMLKEHFLTIPIVDKWGEVVGRRVGSTKELNTEEFSRLIRDVKEYVWEKFQLPLIEFDDDDAPTPKRRISA